jgi:hypothetical protein
MFTSEWIGKTAGHCRFITSLGYVSFAYQPLLLHPNSGAKKVCHQLVTIKSGVFCANFCERRGAFAPCQAAFREDCFGPLGNKPFLIRKMVDAEGEVIEEADESRFLRARAGDMLMLPFQCEICHYRNITKRDPNERDVKDAEVLEFIRRATLDSICPENQLQ